MDNGRNRTDRTMLGSGDAARARCGCGGRARDDGRIRSTEISGLPYGTESNPPGWDPEGRIVVAYDAGNAVLRAWRLEGDELLPLWRRDDIAHAGHLILYPDTRELVVGDWTDNGLDAKARRSAPRCGSSSRRWPASARRAERRCARVTTSSSSSTSTPATDKARVDMPSPSQGFLFPAPGFGRDVYYQSLTTVARVAVR